MYFDATRRAYQEIPVAEQVEVAASLIGDVESDDGREARLELLGVKSPSEFLALSTTQMRTQFDIASAQSKALFALAEQVATEHSIGPSDRK